MAAVLNINIFKTRFKLALKNADRHEIFVMASSLAYTTALALAPFILIVLSLASFLTFDVQEKIYISLTDSLGDKAGTAIKDILQNADLHPKMSGISGIIGFLILVISASAIFSQLKIALDKINEHKISESKEGFIYFLKNKMLSLGLVFGFAFLSVASLIVTMALAVFYPEGVGQPWGLISWGVNFFLFCVLFSAIYRFVPSDKLSFKSCAISGAISSVFYLIGKKIIGMYLASAGIESAYGAAGSLIVLLVWVYYISLTLLFSYEFTKDVILTEQNKTRHIHIDKSMY